MRTTGIDRIVHTFLSSKHSRRKQIISLGAGSDTRYFRLKQNQPDLDLAYHEIDFAANTSRKIAQLRGLLFPTKPRHYVTSTLMRLMLRFLKIEQRYIRRIISSMHRIFAVCETKGPDSGGLTHLFLHWCCQNVVSFTSRQRMRTVFCNTSTKSSQPTHLWPL